MMDLGAFWGGIWWAEGMRCGASIGGGPMRCPRWRTSPSLSVSREAGAAPVTIRRRPSRPGCRGRRLSAFGWARSSGFEHICSLRVYHTC